MLRRSQCIPLPLSRVSTTNQTCSDLQLEFLTQAPIDKALELIRQSVQDLDDPLHLALALLLGLLIPLKHSR
jgi:hypothetical protein